MGELLESTPDTFYIFTDYPVDLANTFYVSAFDWNYNESEKSDPVLYIPAGRPEVECKMVLVYPNPASDIFIVIFPNSTNQKYRFVLRNITGKVVKHRDSIYGNQFEISRGDLPAGVYLMELQGPNIYRGRIVIK
jgi:hypothetical protein